MPGNLKHKPSSEAMSILLLASRMDSASLNIYSELIDTVGWGDEMQMDHGIVSRHHSGLAEALLIEDLHIWADGIDKEHQSKTGREIDEFIVLSRHVSASETPCYDIARYRSSRRNSPWRNR